MSRSGSRRQASRFALWRHLPVVERAQGVRDAKPDLDADRGAAGRRTLFFDRPDRSSRADALGTPGAGVRHRPGLRPSIRRASRLCARARSAHRDANADRRQLPALPAAGLPATRRAALRKEPRDIGAGQDLVALRILRLGSMPRQNGWTALSWRHWKWRAPADAGRGAGADLMLPRRRRQRSRLLRARMLFRP